MRKFFILITIFLIILLSYNYFPYAPIPQGTVVEKLVVDKSERKLMVYSNGSMIKTFSIA